MAGFSGPYGGRVTAASSARAKDWCEVPGEDDRLEPGTSNAADPMLPARRGSQGASVSAPSISAALHANRHRTSGASGPSARNPQRSGYSKDSAAGTT